MKVSASNKQGHPRSEMEAVGVACYNKLNAGARLYHVLAGQHSRNYPHALFEINNDDARGAEQAINRRTLLHLALRFPGRLSQ